MIFGNQISNTITYINENYTSIAPNQTKSSNENLYAVLLISAGVLVLGLFFSFLNLVQFIEIILSVFSILTIFYLIMISIVIKNDVRFKKYPVIRYITFLFFNQLALIAANTVFLKLPQNFKSFLTHIKSIDLHQSSTTAQPFFENITLLFTTISKNPTLSIYIVSFLVLNLLTFITTWRFIQPFTHIFNSDKKDEKLMGILPKKIISKTEKISYKNYYDLINYPIITFILIYIIYNPQKLINWWEALNQAILSWTSQ